MVKLNLNQTLRIIIPGAFFGLLFSFTKTFEDLTSELNVGNFQEGLIGILFSFIAGLVLDIFFQWFHYKFYVWITSRNVYDRQNYYEKWKVDFINKAKTYEYQIEFPNYKKLKELIAFVDASYFSRRYNNAELSYFRYPKSLGIMCFNLAFISLLIFLILVFEYSNLFLIGLCITMIAIFLIASYKYFLKANKRELVYWLACSKEEVEEVIGIFKLWELKDITKEEA